MPNVRQYIGARYVTKIYENSLDPSSAEWESGVNYEPLVMVTYNNGSYLSKKDVPASVGNPAANPQYWVQTGYYNGQIAQLQSDVTMLINRFNTPQNYGALADGVNDDTAAIQAAIDSGIPVYFPSGIYRITDSINVTVPLVGEASVVGVDAGVIIYCDNVPATQGNDDGALVIDQNVSSLYISNIAIDLQECAYLHGISYKPSVRVFTTLQSVYVKNTGDSASGFFISPTSSTSRSVVMNDVQVFGGNVLCGAGVYIGQHAHDCEITGLTSIYTPVGIFCRAGILRLTSCHLYAGTIKATVNQTTLDTYVARSIGVDAYEGILASDVYIDTFYQGWVQRAGNSNVANMVIWSDTLFDGSTLTSGTHLRSVAGALLTVGNLTVGTTRAIWSTLAAKPGVKINQIQYFHDSIDLSHPLVNPLMGLVADNDKYNLHTGSAAYQVVAIGWFNNYNSSMKFSISDNAFKQIVKCIYDNGWTFTSTSDGAGNIPIYYKIDGRLVYFYIARPNNDVWISLESHSQALTLFDLSAMPKYTLPSQADATGLTQIT